MKTKLTIIALAFLLIGCEDETKRKCYVCDEQQRKDVEKFITDNIKSANNMSDEEMEDVISELRESGIKIICNQKYMFVDREGNIKITSKDTLNYYRFYNE